MQLKNFNKYMLLIIALLILQLISIGFAQTPGTENAVRVISLKYVAPDELQHELTAQKYLNADNELIANDHRVKLMINSATNQIMLTGDESGISKAVQFIEFLDVPPRQIIIEAKIIEINNNKMNELGIDWQRFLDRSSVGVNPYYNRSSVEGYDTTTTNNYGFQSWSSVNFSVGELLRIIQDKGVGKIISVPKIVTINNKKGAILDGSRISYITRYSGYSDVYETQEMTAGLLLEVTPSLGESGYLKLLVEAKLTTLGQIISGSPSETGQILENTVIVKDGQEFLLGGFKKSEKTSLKRKVPILGTILPFLFSRTTDIEVNRDFLIILKPTVVDLISPEIPEMK